MNSIEIFGKMSENIIKTLNNFKRGDIDTNFMNEKIVLDLSSIYKFSKGTKNLNNSNLELIIPTSRFEQNLNETIIAENNNKEKIEKGRKSINQSNYDFQQEQDNKIDSLSTKSENTFLRDIKKNENFNNSITEGSLFSESYTFGNKTELRASIISERMSKTNVSTIYGRDINYGNEDALSVISNTSFAKFLNQRLQYKLNRFNDFSYTY